jgi:hypothetical protein
VLQADKRLVKLNLRAVGTVAHIVEPIGEQRRTALHNAYLRVIIAEAIEVRGVEHIQHFLDLVFGRMIKPQQRAVKMYISGY